MTADAFWLKDGWEIPGSDDEMECDLWKVYDNKLIGYFELLTYVPVYNYIFLSLLLLTKTAYFGSIFDLGIF